MNWRQQVKVFIAQIKVTLSFAKVMRNMHGMYGKQNLTHDMQEI